MKLRLAIITCFASSLAAFAQGTVIFNNSPGAIGGNGAPVFDVDGITRLEGTAFLAILWAGPEANSLTAWGEPLTFRTGDGAGFFNTTGKDTSRIIGTVAPGAVTAVQVWVWEDNPWGWLGAVDGGLRFGKSAVITIVTGGAGSPPSLPANLVGLTAFSLIPEPATFALFAAGAIALFLRRRS